MNNPLVSVIIPNYCHSKYLDLRIQSVLNQTYQNFEVIILDDASPDNGASKSVIENYRDNPHVSQIVYNEKNSGSTFKQWNKGFELAKGDLIWIAESDDVAMPNLLETAINNFKLNPNLVLSYCNSEYIDCNDNTLWIPRNTPYNKTYSMIGKLFVPKYMMGVNHIYNASAVVFKKNVISDISPELYNIYKAAGDRMFWALISLHGDVAYDVRPLNKFRQHNVKVSSNALHKGITLEEDCEIYLNLLKFVSPSWCQRVINLGVHRNLIKTCVDSPLKQKELLELWNKVPGFNRFNSCAYWLVCEHKRNIQRMQHLIIFMKTGKWKQNH